MSRAEVENDGELYIAERSFVRIYAVSADFSFNLDFASGSFAWMKRLVIFVSTGYMRNGRLRSEGSGP